MHLARCVCGCWCVKQDASSKQAEMEFIRTRLPCGSDGLLRGLVAQQPSFYFGVRASSQSMTLLEESGTSGFGPSLVWCLDSGVGPTTRAVWLNTSWYYYVVPSTGDRKVDAEYPAYPGISPGFPAPGEHY